MTGPMDQIGRAIALVLLIAAAALADGAATLAVAEEGKTQSLWFDPTQLPSFTSTGASRPHQ